uniref:Uncharacterized protein n=1 Tax=Setaria italica TaxID=4555 RepID=K4ANM0_SETIT
MPRCRQPQIGAPASKTPRGIELPGSSSARQDLSETK